MRKKIITIFIVILMLDQLIKLIAETYLTNVTLVPNFLSLVYAENTGVAFSMLSGGRALIIVISIILLLILTYFLNKDYISKENDSSLLNLTYGLLYGGIFGNLYDRIVRKVVVDYVSFNIFGYHFPIFNLADVSITMGVILYFIYTIKNDKKMTLNDTKNVK